MRLLRCVKAGLPEQHFGPLVAAQDTPGLEAVQRGGGALGNVVLHSAHRAAHVNTWRPKGVKKHKCCQCF